MTHQKIINTILLEIKNSRLFVSALLLFFSVPHILQAQMFSVDDSPGNSGASSVAVFAGIEPIDFEYQGDAAVLGAETYSFSGNIIRFKLESPGINVYLGTAGSATGLDDFSYFDAGIKFGYGLSLYRSEAVSLQLPFLLHSSLTSVNNSELAINTAPEFSQGTFEVGGGLDFNARLAPKFRIGANIVPSYGFSFSTRGSDADGTVADVEAQARFYFDQLFGDAGLSLGYDYNYREFRIDGEVLDYNASAHSILIGVTF